MCYLVHKVPVGNSGPESVTELQSFESSCPADMTPRPCLGLGCPIYSHTVQYVYSIKYFMIATSY